MKKNYLRIADYLAGTAKAMLALSKEIKQAKQFDNESRELMSEIGSSMLFKAVASRYFDED